MAEAANAIVNAPARPLPAVFAPPVPGAGEELRSTVQTDDGTLVAGGRQLMIFDGMSWRPVPITGATNFRALAASNIHGRNRIWLGGLGALGYVEPAGGGSWEYRSLLPELARTGESPPSEIWGVRALGDGAVWVSDRLVMRWMPPSADQPGGFDVWRLESKNHLSLFDGDNEVFLRQEGVGLLRLGPEGGPALVLADTVLPAGMMTWLLPKIGRDGESIMGFVDGVYALQRNRTIAPLPELTAALSGAVPTCATAVGENVFAVGTLKSGVVLADTNGRVLERNLLAPGATDAAVHALYFRHSQLWAASSAGIARLEVPGDGWWFERQNGLGGGRPLRTVEFNERTYVLTSNALFVVDHDSTSHAPWLRLVQLAPTSFSDLVVAADALWVAGFGGLWRLSDDRLVHEYPAAGDVTQVCPMRQLDHGLVFVESNRLKALEPDSRGSWTARELGVDAPDSVVSLQVDAADRLWVSTLRQGVLCFDWTASRQLLYRQFHLRPGSGLPAAASRASLTRLGDRLFAFTPDEILRWDDQSETFVASPDLAAFAGIAASEPLGASGYWLVRPRTLTGVDQCSLMRVELSPNETVSLHPLLLPGLSTVGPPSLFSLTGASGRGEFWIGSSLGLLRISSAAATPSPPPRAIELPAPYGPERSPIFYFPTPALITGEPVFYQTRLEGVDTDWSPPSRVPARVFSALDSGKYRFEVRLVDSLGRFGPVSTQRFVVRAPWWRTSQAIASYIGIAALLVALIAQWRIVRLRRLNERLNQLVAERTREIELSSTAKSNFLENISHEIRNPLNGLTGLLDLLKEDHLDPRERAIARSLKSVASTLTQVFEDVLQFSKLEYGYGRLELRPFALRPLLDEVVALFSAQASLAGCTLELQWPAGLADGFQGDPDRIKTILANFVSNALKYAPGAPIELRIESTGENDGLVDLYLDVVDHGPGVPADEQELIFRKFMRGRRALKEKIPGSGLGLATCAMLAKLMNGNVGVESQLGQGATFSLKLLLPRAPLPAEAVTAPAAAPLFVDTERWLVVDDEDYNRAVLVGIAAELGITCDEAGSAGEAIERFTAGRHTTVLLDWELPDGNGGEVARQLRTRVNGQAPLILATTAHDSEEMRARCRAAGMNGFVLKPYNATRVRAALAAARSPTPASTALVSSEAGGVDLGSFASYARARGQTPEAAREAFLAALGTQAASLEAALSARDHRATAHAAHRLRGLAGVVNATALNQASARLEKATEGASPSDLASRWSDVQRELTALQRQLTAPARS